LPNVPVANWRFHFKNENVGSDGRKICPPAPPCPPPCPPSPPKPCKTNRVCGRKRK
jgi:hypothetical protein